VPHFLAWEMATPPSYRVPVLLGLHDPFHGARTDVCHRHCPTTTNDIRYPNCNCSTTATAPVDDPLGEAPSSLSGFSCAAEAALQDRQKEAFPSCPDLDCCEDRRQAVPEKSGGGRRRKRIMPPPPTPTPPPHTPPASDPEPVKAYGRGQGSRRRRRRRRRREPCRDNDGDLLLPAADDAAPSP
jgi:hypothetical protein